MTYRHRTIAAGALLLGIALSRGDALAAGQGIAGTKLLLQNIAGREKMLLLSKDGLVTAGPNDSPSDPRCQSSGCVGGAVELDDGINTAVLSMPSSRLVWGWKSIGAGPLYKFVDKDDVSPYPAPKVAKIKAGLLKVVSKTLGGFPIPSGPATISVTVRVGLDQYCLSFTGTGDGSRFLAKDAAAAVCPSTPGCTGESVGGACWFLADGGQSCDDACSALGKTCGPATINYAGTGGTFGGCYAVHTAILLDPFSEGDSSCAGQAAGCVASQVADPNWGTLLFAGRCTGAPTTCSAIPPNSEVQRLCACQ